VRLGEGLGGGWGGGGRMWGEGGGGVGRRSLDFRRVSGKKMGRGALKRVLGCSGNRLTRRVWIGDHVRPRKAWRRAWRGRSRYRLREA
jgi:hypothetical protein